MLRVPVGGLLQGVGDLEQQRIVELLASNTASALRDILRELVQ